MEYIQGFSPSFIIAYIAGGIFLLLFCIDRFDQPVRKGSFVETLVPRHLATHSEYLRTFLIYYIIMWLIYTLLTLVGPSILQLFEAETQGFTELANNGAGDLFNTGLNRDKYPTWFPLAVVLILAGAASSRFEFLNKIELIVRQLTHRIIGIPEGIQNRAESLNRARINLSALSDNDIDFIKHKYNEVTGQYISNIQNYYKETEKQDSVLIKWIRLQLLFEIIEHRQRDLPKGFNTAILRSSYKSMWDQIKTAIYDLSAKKISDAISDHNDELDHIARERTSHTRDRVDNTLHDIHSIIAACVTQNTRDNDDLPIIMEALRLVAAPDKKLDLSQAFIVTFFIVFIFIFLVVFSTPAIIKLIGVNDLSPYMPSDHRKALSWAFSTVFLHGAAALAILRYRIRLGKKWKKMRIRETEIPASQYLYVMVLAYIAATIGLGTWWFLKEALVTGLTLPSKEEYWIPLFGLLGIATGFWTSYSLDIAERDGKVSKKRLISQAVMQSITTGVLCYLLIIMMPNMALDFAFYTSTIAALSGLIIGLIIILFVRQLHLKEGQKVSYGHSVEVEAL